MAGKLQDASGILVGDFCDCTPKRNLSLSLEEVIDYYIKLANKPALKGFLFGHCNPQISIPFGVQATLNTFEKKVSAESGIV
jgi:muramoyltetrapeptide carboxypeptidase